MKRGVPAFVYRRLDPAQRYGLRLTLAAVGVVLVAVPFSALLFEVLAKGPLTRIDGDVANRLNDLVHGHPVWVHVLEAVSWLGRPPTLWVLTAAGAVWTFRRHQRRLTLFLIATTLGGAIVSTSVKLLVDRPRPEVDHPIITAFGKSFPSGHALSSTVVFGALLLTFLPAVPLRYRTVSVVTTATLVAAIGASRVLLGVHFLSDVIAGFVLGLAWLALATAAFEIWRVERGRRTARPLAEGVEPEAGRTLSPAAAPEHSAAGELGK
jgi:undecaprenyl-diphosphatase